MDKYPDEIYGTYESNTTTESGFSRLKLLKENSYTLVSTHVLGHTQDTGTFAFIKDILYLTSAISQAERQKNTYYTRLALHKLFRKENKIYYVFPPNPVDKKMSLDTKRFWTKK
jgi:hypothetical protein